MAVGMGAALLGTVLSVIGTVRYLRDVRHGTTVPHRGSWLVWSVIAVIAAAAHGAAGVGWSLAVLAAQALSTVAVLVASVRHGVGGVTRGNALLLLVAAAGVVGWLTLSDPVAAAGCAALADGAGLVAIVPKIWTAPHSETASTYGLAGVTGLLAVLSVPAAELSLLLFPTYYCLANGAVAQLITRRRLRSEPAACGPVPCEPASSALRESSGNTPGVRAAVTAQSCP